MGPAAETSNLNGASSGDQIESCVARATETLRKDLERAAYATDDWRQEALGRALVTTALDTCLRSLADTRCWGRDNQAPSGILWRALEAQLETGDLQSRARLKPRGYAGDYIMMTQICADYRSSHPLGRFFDHYFQSQAAVAAVRSRTEQIGAALTAHSLWSPQTCYRAANIGSGPALDFAQALACLPAHRRTGMDLCLLELDSEALEDAQRRLRQAGPEARVTCARENLFRLIGRPQISELLAGTDFIVCAGLFDYLPDEPAAALLRLCWQSLRAGGKLLVGNFAPHCPSRAYMEWIGNWYLLYRTSDQLRQLAATAGIPANCCGVAAERLGIDLFLVADRA